MEEEAVLGILSCRDEEIEVEAMTGLHEEDEPIVENHSMVVSRDLSQESPPPQPPSPSPPVPQPPSPSPSQPSLPQTVPKRMPYTEAEDRAVLDAVRAQLPGRVSWEEVACAVPGRTKASIQKRYSVHLQEERTKTCKRTNLKRDASHRAVASHHSACVASKRALATERGVAPESLPNTEGGWAGVTWSPGEDQRLIELVKQYGVDNWDAIASFMADREAVHCRARWMTRLDPSLHIGPFTAAEDKLLVKLVAEMGPKWKEISLQMPGRMPEKLQSRHKTVSKRHKTVSKRHTKGSTTDVKSKQYCASCCKHYVDFAGHLRRGCGKGKLKQQKEGKESGTKERSATKRSVKHSAASVKMASSSSAPASSVAMKRSECPICYRMIPNGGAMAKHRTKCERENGVSGQKSTMQSSRSNSRGRNPDRKHAMHAPSDKAARQLCCLCGGRGADVALACGHRFFCSVCYEANPAITCSGQCWTCGAAALPVVRVGFEGERCCLQGEGCVGEPNAMFVGCGCVRACAVCVSTVGMRLCFAHREFLAQETLELRNS